MSETAEWTEIEKSPAPSGDNHAKRWLILAVLGIAQLMVVLDATIVNIALPAAQRSLEFGDSDRQWIITAYALAFGSLLLLGGRLSDLFGRRRTFIVGLIGFAVTSAIGGAAVNFEMLVAARAGQGVFGALLAPAALSLLSVTFTDPAERAKAFGIFGAVAGGGGAIGLLLGGALTEWVDWRWCLYVNLFFAAIALVGAVLLLAPHVTTGARPKLDIPGTVLVSISLFGIVFGFSKAESNGWGAGSTIAWLTAGVVFMAAFIYWQTKSDHPLLPLRVVTDRIRAGSYLAIFLSGAGMFAVFLFLTYYMQLILGYTPIVTGLAFMPMVFGIVTAATLSTAVLLPRFGPRILITSGMVIAAIGMIILAQISVDSTYAVHILPGLVVTGLGMGSIFAPSMQGATSGVRYEDAGVASATVNTMQQVGGSIGTALLSTIAASASTNYLVGRELNPLTQAQAAVESYTTTFYWAAAIFAVGAVLTGLVVRSGLLPAAPENEPVLVH
ncbi:MFS transporter [Rhodococcus sp. KBS0724]|jgi:EmrB/QacA subfamily drug resistance transporter|uniref:MFS transporter n=1 Tax=Rhodococcus sp. KBS0724 TaxID=1179674 RepID=UPI00110DBF83|nr:MFS transporter [Rhodococcus sp. KBS0724]TSD49253.1 MFS transporter [Rhodococcus sp. KBS0724]